jgi:hypothetical protein
LDGTPCFTVAAHYISVADVLLATGANDSSDWLRRNDSYTWTFCTRSNIARTDTDTVITGIMKWLLFLAFHVIFIFLLWQTMLPRSRLVVQENRKKREREPIRFATMSIEERTERNTKQRERYNIMKSAGLSVGFNYKFIIFVE